MHAADILRETSPRRANLPSSLSGPVVKGFGRGSKQLGFPTANIPVAPHEETLRNLATGIYYGYARVNNSNCYHCVISIGWNPFYKNQEKSIEVHILRRFDNDFYGAELTIHLMGYIRAECDFASKEDLIQAIHDDIAYSRGKISDIERIY